MTPSEDVGQAELELLRTLVRGHVHHLNNLLQTLGFAIETFVPEDTRPEMRGLVSEASSALADIRRSAAPPGLRGHERRPELEATLAAGLRLAENAPGSAQRMSLGPVAANPLPDELTWPLTRLTAALALAFTSEEVEELEVSVEDDGEAIWRFFGAEPLEAERVELALRLPRQLALLLSTEIRVSPQVDGLELRLTLPLERSAEVSRHRQAPLSSLERLLVVDDNLTLRLYLQKILRAAGIEVVMASSVREAAQLAQEAAPEAALIDLHLDGESGVELALTLNEVAKIPIVMMSGDELDAEVAEALERVNAVGYLRKPFEVKALRALLISER